jgi:pimeloyl-ACP methyl ester carboxylesterase
VRSPHRHARSLGAALLTTGAILAGCGDDGSSPASGEAANPEAAVPAPEHISFPDLKSCKGTEPGIEGFRCGSIERPKFYSAPEKGTFDIGFAVRRRSDAGSPSQGTIFAVEGGPGYASSGTANAYLKLLGNLVNHRELVLVDMRGTGRSGPIRCPDIQLGRAPEWIGTSECARRLGEDFEAYNTGAAAEDIDGVREALGAKKIALYGDSYGTYLSQAYAFRHPDTLDAVVLDGAYPVRGENPWYPSLITAGNEDFALACKRSPSCPPGAAGRLDRMAKYLRRNGMSVGSLIDAVAGGAYSPPDSYLTVERAGRALLDDRRRLWRRLNIAETVASRDRFSYSRPEEFAVGCNDYPMIWDRDASEAERRVQLERSIRDDDPEAFGPFTPREVALSSTSGYLECLTWPRPTELREPPVRPGMQPTDAPVLVVNGELDDLTTPFEGRLTAELFPDSKRFVGRNVGHVSSLYYPDGPSARTIRRFLRRSLAADD